MRIFVAALGCGPRRTSLSYWRSHLIDPLLEIGHEAVESRIDWDSVLLENTGESRVEKARRGERLLREVQAAHASSPISLFFAYLTSRLVDGEVIKAISRLGIPTVLFWCDSLHSLDLIADIAPAFTLCWASEREAPPLYRAIGANVFHLPMAANPALCRPVGAVTPEFDALFAGRLYADRPTLLAGLLQRGVKVKILTADLDRVGPDNQVRCGGRSWTDIPAHWLRYGTASLGRALYRRMVKAKHLPFVLSHSEPSNFSEGFHKLLERSTTVLNFSAHYFRNEPGGRIVRYAKLRDFEQPMSRVLYCPEYVPELESYYDDGREVIMWRTLDELTDKIAYYRKHPEQAETIRWAGYQRALAEHQWKHRYEKLFQALPLTKAIGASSSL